VSKPRNLKTLKIRELTNEINRLQRNRAYRFIAVWILVEAFAGGVLHALNLPFSGLLINGMALLCILFIARYSQTVVSILQATLLVALFKFILSPQSPPTAYLAVFFQGLTGQFLFYRKPITRAKSILMAVITFLESGAQRILVLWIFYGDSFWNAFNGFVAKLTHQSPGIAYARWLAVGYLFIHLVAGFLIGNYAYLLVSRSESWRMQHQDLQFKHSSGSPLVAVAVKRKPFRIGLSWFFLLLLIGMMLHDQFYPSNRFIPDTKLAAILVRIVLILLGWILLIKPLMAVLLRNWLRKQQSLHRSQLTDIQEQLPEVRWTIEESWRQSASASGFARWRLFLKTAIVNLL
jgi:hypothetical protein